MSLDDKLKVYKYMILTLEGRYPSINSFKLIDWIEKNIK